jgi:hypothetical protein
LDDEVEVEDVQSPAEDDDTGCTRCDAPLIFLGEKKFHEGDSGGFGLILGPFRELAENRQRIEMWACHDCGHVEFFMPLRKTRRTGND